MFKLSRVENPRSYVELLDRLLELPPSALDRVAEAIRRQEGAT
jgi:hypothetical protein